MSNAPTPSEPRPVASSSSDDTARPPGDTGRPPGARPTDPDFRAGSRPVPEYVLVEKLGEGGFGQVWKARDDGGFEVALKFLRLDSRAGAIELRAVDVMKNVRHAHVLPMFRSWQVGGWLVLALELGEKTLYQRLAEAEKQGQTGIPRAELLEYMAEAAKGLDYLHTLNIQHRDVKPQNLLLVGGTVKVADFGLAKLLEQGLASNSGSLTVAYAAPEQFQGRVSPHSDQYSLAVSYCQLCGAGLPFRGTQQEIVLGHIQGWPDLSGLSAAEGPAVAKALSKKPEQRWPSCRAFVEALPAAAVTRAPTAPPPTLPEITVFPKRQSRWYAVGGLALIAALAAGIVIASLPPGSGGPTAATKPDLSKPVRERPQPLDCTGEAGVSTDDVRKAQEAWAQYLGRNVEETVEIADGVPITFVLIPPGKFRMGSPEGEADRGIDEKLHTVVLGGPFDLGKYEVTQAQYRAVVNRANSAQLKDPDPSHFKGEKGEADLPVESVSWDEADAFGRELTKLLSDRHVYRLPTEAEWEYGCRGGRPSSQAFGIGNGHTLSSREANFDGNFPYGGAGKGTDLQKTNKVGSYEQNALGLYDMHGNVWEWCSDHYGPYPEKETTNPGGATRGPHRVFRGGGWIYLGKCCRAAYRDRYVPGFRVSNLGFRLARSLPSDSE